LSEKQTKDDVFELITLVVEKYKKVTDIFLRSPYTFPFVTLLMMLIFVEIYLFSIDDVGKQLSIAIPFSALIFVFFTMFERSFEDTIIRAR